MKIKEFVKKFKLIIVMIIVAVTSFYIETNMGTRGGYEIISASLTEQELDDLIQTLEK